MTSSAKLVLTRMDPLARETLWNCVRMAYDCRAKALFVFRTIENLVAADLYIERREMADELQVCGVNTPHMIDIAESLNMFVGDID